MRTPGKKTLTHERLGANPGPDARPGPVSSAARGPWPDNGKPTEIQIREVPDPYSRRSWKVYILGGSGRIHFQLEHGAYPARETAVWTGRRVAADLGVRCSLWKGGRCILLPRYTPAEDALREERVERRGLEVVVFNGSSSVSRTYKRADYAEAAARRLLFSKAARERFFRPRRSP